MPPTHPTRRPSLLHLLAIVSGLVLLLAACGSDGGDEGAGGTSGGDRPTIVVTTTILGDLVERLVADDAEVEVLMPPGADPHDYELSAAQTAAVREADLVVANGLGLEERVLDVVEAAEADGVAVIEVAPQLDPVPFQEPEAHDHDEAATDDHDHDEAATDDHDHAHDEGTPVEEAGAADDHGHEGEGHDHDGDDPHVWLDPDRMAAAAPLLATEIAEATGLDAAALEARATTYADEAVAAGAEAEQLLAAVPEAQRVMVTNHDALGYFARRFDLRVIGVVIPGGSTMAEPSAAEIAELAEAVRESGVSAIFAENTVDATVIDAVAREAGGDVAVVELTTDSLGDPGTATGTYAGMIVENARLVAEGLTGQGS